MQKQNETDVAQEKKKAPEHVGLILDGNRRWAKERNLPTYEGHHKGYEKLKMVPDWFKSRGVKIISAYVFSTENWQRSRDEVNYLMKLIKTVFENDFDEFNEKGYRILVSGRIDELPGDLPEVCQKAMDETKTNAEGVLNICLNYGGRTEIVDAIRKMIANNISSEQIHEGLIKKYLYQDEIPYPDLIIRTSGEKRISGYLLWQAAYSELAFIEKYWPDFEESDVELILEDYANRKRRFGGDG